MRPPKVMVAGRWDETDPVVLRTTHEFGAWLAYQGIWLVTGGGGGVAKACAAGAIEGGGTLIEFHPSNRQAGAFDDDGYSLTVFADCGWDGRSLAAVKSSDVLVVFGGQAGTLLEIVVAYQQSLPIVVLRGSGEMVSRLETFLVAGAHLDQRRTGRLEIADSIDACKSAVLALAGDGPTRQPSAG